MSVDYRIVFLRKPDDPEHDAKVTAALALRDVGIDELPPKLAEYFGTKWSGIVPDEMLTAAAVSVTNPCADEDLPEGVTDTGTKYANAVEIDLDKLPKDIRRLIVEVS